MKRGYRTTINAGSVTFHWWVLGPLGAVHTWATTIPPKHAKTFGYDLYGKVLFHYPTQPSYMDAKPSHEKCWILNGPCWHDGSSSQFEEDIKPWLSGVTIDSPNTTGRMWNYLEGRYPELEHSE